MRKLYLYCFHLYINIVTLYSLSLNYEVHREVQTEILLLKGKGSKIGEDIRMYVGNSWNGLPALLNTSVLKAVRYSNHVYTCRNRPAGPNLELILLTTHQPLTPMFMSDFECEYVNLMEPEPHKAQQGQVQGSTPWSGQSQRQIQVGWRMDREQP